MRDVILTGVTSVCATLSLIIITKLLARSFGPELFGAYSLGRRSLMVLTSLSTIPMGVALARYIAMAADRKRQVAYLAAGLLANLTCGVAVLLAGVGFRDGVAAVAFHSSQFAVLVVAVLMLYVGMCSYSVMFAFHRGRGSMRAANVYNLIFMALGPLAVTAVLHSTGDPAIVTAGMAIVALLTIIPAVRTIYKATPLPWDMLRDCLGDLLRYAGPRVPGGLAFAGLMATGPYAAGVMGSLQAAGFLVIGQSLMTIAESGTEAFGLVALPRVASMMNGKHPEYLRDRISDITGMVVHFGLFLTIQLMLWSDQIVFVWLGGEYADAIPIIRISVLAVVPYLAYSMLRSVVDAVEVRSINTINMFRALCVTAILSGVSVALHAGPLGLAISTAAGLLVLGASTVSFLRKRFPGRSPSLHWALCLGTNLGLVTCEWAVKALLRPHLAGEQLLALGGVCAFIAGLVYLAILYRSDVNWVVELRTRLLRAEP